MTTTHDVRPSYAGTLAHEAALMRENHELRRQLDALYEHVDALETDAACGIISDRPRAYLDAIRDRCSLLLRGPRLA